MEGNYNDTKIEKGMLLYFAKRDFHYTFAAQQTAA